jgi:hypothetical protein
MAPGTALAATVEGWGWMLCDGRALPVKVFGELYRFIGHQYDSQREEGRFFLPDYRGYFLRGVDDQSGHDPDAASRVPLGTGTPAQVGSHQPDALRNHHHASGAGVPMALGKEPAGAVIGLDGAIAGLPPGVSGLETRPKNISVHYLIRYTSHPRLVAPARHPYQLTRIQR